MDVVDDWSNYITDFSREWFPQGATYNESFNVGRIIGKPLILLTVIFHEYE